MIQTFELVSIVILALHIETEREENSPQAGIELGGL